MAILSAPLAQVGPVNPRAMRKRIRRSALKYKKRFGFRSRMKTRGGRAIIKRRRLKGRKLPGAP